MPDTNDFWSETVTFDGETITRRDAAARRRHAGVPVAETVALMRAGAATFAEGEWKPSTYKGGPNKGQPCERHPVSGKARPPQDGAATPGQRETSRAAAAFDAISTWKDAAAAVSVLRGTAAATTPSGKTSTADPVDPESHAASLRLFACACAEACAGRARSNTLRPCLDVARAYAEGRASKEDVASAERSASATCREYHDLIHPDTYASRLVGHDGSEATTRRRRAAYRAACAVAAACNADSGNAATQAMSHLSDSDHEAGGLDVRSEPRVVPPGGTLLDSATAAASDRRIADLLKYVVGNPYRPTRVHADDDARAMAAALEASGDAATAGILADHQEEHGCQAAADVLRSRPYVKGCCVARAILSAAAKGPGVSSSGDAPPPGSPTAAPTWSKESGKRYNSTCGRFHIINCSMTTRPRWVLFAGERQIHCTTLDSAKRKATKLAANPKAAV